MLRFRFAALSALCFLQLFLLQAFCQRPSQGLGELDLNEIHRIQAGRGGVDPGGANGVLLDLNLMRLQPASLDDPKFFKYFVALNNCANPQIDRLVESEFDFPRIAAFYRAKAPTILNAVPATILIQLPPVRVGEYDPARKAFPIMVVGKHQILQPEDLVIDHVDPAPDRSALIACRPASTLHYSNPVYRIAFQPLRFSVIPVDEGTARKFVLDAPAYRTVNLVIEVEILPQTPTIYTAPGRPNSVLFNGQVKRVTAFDPKVVRTGSMFTGVVHQDKPIELGVLFP